jgi:hypothetical protein
VTGGSLAAGGELAADRWGARAPGLVSSLRSRLAEASLRRRLLHRIGPMLALGGLMAACRPHSAPFFQLLSTRSTGVTFENRVPDDTAFNMINFLYYYDGGGVAAGDVNGDGLPDLYFTSNRGPNHLYLNKGNYRFEDVTARAGVADSVGWKTGVTMADVNGDGRLDIFVSGVDYLSEHGHDVLYINNGDGTFTDRTREYGLEFSGYSTQALFFDYDGDGDLDMYLLNASVHSERGRSVQPQREPRNPRAGDRLYRNDGGHFVDVSAQAGIYGGVEGYGLGVVASDFDGDGCPDLYIANDFQENDYLYHNNCNGTFTETIATAMGHTSRASMGVDAADFNNDGRPDVMVLDMLPAREDILKTSASTQSYALADLEERAGYHPQFGRNTLQLNRGDGRFSDIGYLAGVAATDWSWTPLFADLDNDGRKDLFVTNGIVHRPNDLDYLTFVGTPAMQTALANGITRGTLDLLLQRMPHIPIANYAFHNNGDLTFTNMAAAWGLAQPGFSTGAVYVDLNHSGALDLVVNNINAPAAIYRNRASERTGNHYLEVVLRGSGANTAGIGSKVLLWQSSHQQLLEQMPTRGFQSSVDPTLHFGLGGSPQIDSLAVIWPDRRTQVFAPVTGDRTLTIFQDSATGRWRPGAAAPAAPVRFSTITPAGLSFVHRENTFWDYDREPLMPQLLSTEGPALATGDINGDGLEDVYVGGAKWQPGRVFIRQRDGSFRAVPEPDIEADSLSEDVDAAFFDADGDGDLDLYVVSAGNEFWGDAAPLRDRLYLNDGHGLFRRAPDALPAFFDNGSCVVPGDFDGDGHPDLFVGGRVVSRSYGLTPQSHLLHNDGTGHFQDVTRTLAPDLARAGMVTSAAWVDYDHDGHLDLIVVGEWMPIRVFHQENGHFVDRTATAGLAGSDGWWNSVTVADLNGDGRPDLVLGNLGLNSFMRASATEPARLYIADFAHTKRVEQILTFYRSGVSYPLAGRDELLQVIPSLRNRFRSYHDFGASRIQDVFPAKQLRQATVLQARDFATSVALNNGDGTFTLRPLPVEAQFAPVYATLVDDFDGDGHPDLLLAGNLYGVVPVLGRYDASYGLLLRGDGTGQFRAVDMAADDLVIAGQVRHLAWLDGSGHAAERLIVAARNDTTLQVLRWTNSRAADTRAKR